MKKIMHIIDTTGPGGAETVYIELLTRLHSEKYKSIALIRGKGWVYEELKRRGVKPYIIDAKGSFNFRYLFNLIKIIRKERVSLIQAHLLGSSVYGCIAGLLTRIPVVATLHGVVDVEGERFLSAKFFILNLLAGQIVLVSKNLSCRLKEQVSVNANKLSVIYNGADLKAYDLGKHQKLRDELGFNVDDIIIGSVGNVRKAKAYDILLQAASLIVKKNSKIKFLIVGDNTNDLYQKILSLRSELRLEDSVFFLGFRQNVPEFLAGVDVFLLSSISEGCPVSVVEAMASRVPMVVTDCGGLSEMVKGNLTAEVCESGSSSALVDGVMRLVGDENLKRKLVKNARNEAESRFSMVAMLNSYRSIYDSLLHQQSRQL